VAVTHDADAGAAALLRWVVRCGRGRRCAGVHEAAATAGLDAVDPVLTLRRWGRRQPPTYLHDSDTEAPSVSDDDEVLLAVSEAGAGSGDEAGTAWGRRRRRGAG
jgi:hypothetical protein